LQGTIAEQLANFISAVTYEDLPEAAVTEAERLIVDSIGCAFASTIHKRGQIGIAHGRAAGRGPATILGTPYGTTVAGASFANAELINALDHDAVMPPGHVTPYVLPPILAIVEEEHLSGRDLLTAVAIAHEVTWRIGKGMDYLRDIVDGKVSPPPVWGFASSIFGATAAICWLRRCSAEETRHALSIAAIISPVNSAAAWREHTQGTTIKYLLGGWLAQGALTAVDMAQLGHTGDDDIFEPEFGYPRFIGTRRWAPEQILEGLGERWNFHLFQSYKPYPHCRILHAPLDALLGLMSEHKIAPDQIESVKAWVEGFVERPRWTTKTLSEATVAQFSIAHGLALGAWGFTPGPDWHRDENIWDPRVLALMARIEHVVHPDYASALGKDASSRPTRIEVVAEGQTYSAERSHPRGSGLPGSATYLSSEALAEKFRLNAAPVLQPQQTEDLLQALWALRDTPDAGAVISLCRTA